MPAESRIATRIPAFAFDNPAHFGPETYDVVMLFGILETYPGRSPGETLRDAELRVLTEYMNSGGGLFATGDHGKLGRALSHRIPRVRGMRMWDSPADPFVGPVSMKREGPERHQPRWNIRSPVRRPTAGDRPQDVPGLADHPDGFPHPLLCGPRGVIRVMPDHPHEGQCTPAPQHEPGPRIRRGQGVSTTDRDRIPSAAGDHLDQQRPVGEQGDRPRRRQGRDSRTDVRAAAPTTATAQESDASSRTRPGTTSST